MSTVSDLPARMPAVSFGTWHPWRALRGREDVEQIWELEPDRVGSWCAKGRRIRLHPHLTQAERRCVLTHELIHVERGDVGECDDVVERIVDREAARRLLPIGLLLDAIAFYGEDWGGVAEACWVDEETLETRLLPANLHPAERGAIRRVLSLREESA